MAHSAVPVTDDSLSHQCREVVFVVPADTLDSDGDVGTAHGVVSDSDLRANKLGLLLLLCGNGLRGVVRRFGRESGEVLLGEVNELLVGDATSSDEHHAVSGVVGLDVVEQVRTLYALDVLLGAEDSSSEGLALKSGGVEMVEDDFLKLLVYLFLFAENDVALALDGLGV